MAKAVGKTKLWGGAFAGGTHPAVEAFTDSTRYEDRLVPHDISGSVAHARMLGRVGVVSKAEAARLVLGLERVRKEWLAGAFKLDPAFEDVHGNVEARLREIVGPLAGKLHSGRSRNDQVALDERLLLRELVARLKKALGVAAGAWLDFGADHQELILPGYTHLQRGQPVLFGHWALAWVEMWLRDFKRLDHVADALDECPLGAAALAGSTLPLDRAFVARELGFSRVTENSMDSVSDRDYLVDFAYALAMLMQHLSRLGEEIVLYSSQEFGFFRLGDAIATGSSLMPQKRNPDVAELLRGRAGRAYGLLMHLLTLLKGQPLSYNRDMQEDKELFFGTFDLVLHCVRLVPVLAANLEPDGARMRTACHEGFLEATDAADYLVRKGVPFREAHEAVGRAVRACRLKGCTLAELPLEAWKSLNPAFGPDLPRHLRLEAVVAARASQGGTAPARVRQALQRARGRVARALRV
ncbi:MAG TPA: argininosuccinate lyase [bacterium]|jgi:argininosuccinate lyase|nr:argininosuccinate lyase [bacterium]